LAERSIPEGIEALGAVGCRQSAGAQGVKLIVFLTVVAAIAAAGCQQQTAEPPSAQEQLAENPIAGLYTPGSQVGVTEEVRNAALRGSMAGSGASADEAELQAKITMGGNHCIGSTGVPGTPGKLTIDFTTASYNTGKYSPKNCGAIWIEDANGAYIATPAIWAHIRQRPLFFWQTVRCQADTPDAITSATLDDHSKPHSVSWDGKDLKGNVVPDGMYVVHIEVTEDEVKLGRHAKFPFMKGPTAETQTPADTESVKTVKLTYTPDMPTMPTGM
jgi:hypothetical protein